MGWIGPFLCRHGYHSWVFLWMKDKRLIQVSAYSDWVCTVAERCRRCRLRRVRTNTKIPKRIKIDISVQKEKVNDQEG